MFQARYEREIIQIALGMGVPHCGDAIFRDGAGKDQARVSRGTTRQTIDGYALVDFSRCRRNAGPEPCASCGMRLLYWRHPIRFGESVEMSKLVIVVHYHEIWLKGGNRRFFLSKLHMALKRALEGLPVERILRPGDRLLIEFGEGASAEEAIARIERVFGVAFYAVARVVPRGGEDDLAALGRAAWEEVRGEKFSTFAVRAKRSDKSFPHRTSEIEVSVGQYLVDQLRAEGRDVRVKLNDPDLTCRIEIPPGPSLLVYARKIPGAGGLPPNTAGRMTCLLSGRIRFGRCRAQNDEARRALELRAFLGRRGAARRIFGSRGAGTGAATGAVAIFGEALPGAV